MFNKQNFMAKLTEDQRNDDLVKSLLEGGFEESVVAGWLEDGTITLEKSVPEEEEEEKEVKPEDGKDPDEKSDPENDDDPDGEGDGEKELEKGCGEKDAQEIAKSVTAEVLKSLNSMIGTHDDDIVKSIGVAVESAVLPFAERFDKIEKSIDGMRAAIEAFGSVAPGFKSAGLNRAVIEKSISGSKDEHEKTVLSVSRDRAVVRTLIEKSIEEEKDADIQKSLRENTQAYLLDPLGGAIGEMAARYMYDNKNVRLVK